MNANITLAQEWIAQADAILIGASNGLSIAEGYHIFANNEMFRRQFGDMHHFLTKYSGKKLVILELGIGSRNRLIKLPIMQLAYREPNAKYITLNMPQELYIPEEIAEKSVGIAGDIAQSLKELNSND